MRQQSNRRRLSSSTRTAGVRLSSSISIWTQSRAVVGLHRPSASSEAWRSDSDLRDSGRKSCGGFLSDSIFVGGISELISSDMLMEIAKSFGHLKTYHFEFNADLNEPCAFLEGSTTNEYEIDDLTIDGNTTEQSHNEDRWNKDDEAESDELEDVDIDEH